MMISKSFLLVLMPCVFTIGFIGVDYALPDEEFEITQFHVNMIETVIGGTIIGGTANAGFKRYMKVKQTIANTEILKNGNNG